MPQYKKRKREVKRAANAHAVLQKMWEHNALSTRHTHVTINQQDGAVVARHAHNVKAAGPIPAPATK